MNDVERERLHNLQFEKEVQELEFIGNQNRSIKWLLVVIAIMLSVVVIRFW